MIFKRNFINWLSWLLSGLWANIDRVTRNKLASNDWPGLSTTLNRSGRTKLVATCEDCSRYGEIRNKKSGRNKVGSGI